MKESFSAYFPILSLLQFLNVFFLTPIEIYGLVRMCLSPMARQATANCLVTYAGPLFDMTCRHSIPCPSN